MIDYKSPVGDILFALRHGAAAHRLPDWDDELAGEIITQAARFVDGEIAPLDVISDTQGAQLIDGRVQMPAAFHQGFHAYCEGGWPSLGEDAAYGGQGLPHVLGGALGEMMNGACIAFQMVLSLGGAAARSISAHGTEEQKQHYLPKLASGEWLASMALSEPQAGSDLGLIKTTAQPDTSNADLGWTLEGTKVFISGGDHDLTENIIHLVLARTPDAPPGLKGLALFLCPAVLPDGTRNAIQILRLEEKMGLHGSPTCQMAFDRARCEMLGGPGEGLMRMFTMMNLQRLEVSLQGVALADVAGQRSRHHAAERRQGRAAKGSGPDPINRHGDVQRMLMGQMAMAQGLRALVYRTYVELDLDPRNPLLNFLTPVCKAFTTDAAVDAANDAVQIHGGYGFCREYRVEQIVRDARITTIYEGTNGIQAMTLGGRVVKADAAAVQAFADDVADAAQNARPETAQALNTALAQWSRATDAVRALDDVGLVATSYLRLCGLLALGAMWARLEGAAQFSPNPDRTRALAQFSCQWLLPETEGLAQKVTLSVSKIDDAILTDA